MLYEAAEVLGDEELIEEVKEISIKMADVTEKEGFSSNGGMYYEKAEGHIQLQFDWWPQAESVVGFFNAWQITKNDNYLKLAVRSWEFIKKYIIDKNKGEWFWGLNKQLQPLPGDKVNGWKAPYHNGRMCMEMMRRIEHL